MTNPTEKAKELEEAAIRIIQKERGQPFPSDIECFKLGAQWQQTHSPDMKQWVSVEDRLPEYYKPILVFCLNTPNQYICWRASDGDNDIYTIFGTANIVRSVSHWQPLPEPPNSTTTPKIEPNE